MLERETRLEEQKQYGMFSLIILSHGDKSCVYGSDARPIYYNDIYKRLGARTFRMMAGKPKLLIFQACSGLSSEKLQLTEDSCEVDEEFKNIGTVSASGRARPESAQISPNSDLFILRSSFPGYVSLLDRSKGSFLIKAFVEVMQQNACKDELEILTKKVRSTVYKTCEQDMKMFEKYGHQTIFNSSTLTKSLYLFPGFDPTKPLQSAVEAAQPVMKPIKSTASQPQPAATERADKPEPINCEKLIHLKDIETPEKCHTVCHLPDGRLLHGGHAYGLLGFTEKLNIYKWIYCLSFDESTGKLFALTMASPDWLIFEIDTNTGNHDCVIKYPTNGSFDPCHLAVNKTYIVTTDTKVRGIKVFSKGGDYQHLYDVKLDGVRKPWGIEFLNESELVISEFTKDFIVNVRLSEKPEIVWKLTKSDGIAKTTAVHVHRQRKQIFVTRISGDKLLIISYTGELLQKLDVPNYESGVQDISVFGDDLILANGDGEIKKYRICST